MVCGYSSFWMKQRTSNFYVSLWVWRWVHIISLLIIMGGVVMVCKGLSNIKDTIFEMMSFEDGLKELVRIFIGVALCWHSSEIASSMIVLPIRDLFTRQKRVEAR